MWVKSRAEPNFQILEFCDKPIPIEIALYIFSFANPSTLAQCVLVSKSWKVLIYRHIEIDYFSYFYLARRQKTGALIHDPELEAQLPGYAANVPFPALACIPKGNWLSNPNLGSFFLDHSFDLKTFNIPESLTANPGIKIGNIKAFLETRMIMEIFEGQTKMLYVVEKDSEEILDKIEFLQNWELKGTLLMLFSEELGEEGKIKLYSFNDEVNRFECITDNLFRYREYNKEGECPTHERVLLNSSKNIVGQTNLEDAALLDDRYVALIFEFPYCPPDLYVYSTITCELSCIVRKCFDDALIRNVKIAENHVGVLHNAIEPKFRSLSDRKYAEMVSMRKVDDHEEVYDNDENQAKTLCIHNLLTGHQTNFTPDDFLPNQEAAFKDFKIIEKENTQSVVVQLEANCSLLYFEIPLGEKYDRKEA